MKKEKGVTLLSLLTYIAALLAVMVIIGRITMSFRTGLDEIETENAAASDYSKLNTCLLKETKEKENVKAKLGNMVNSGGFFEFVETPGAAKKTAVQFEDGSTIGLVNGRVYYDAIKICDDVENMEIKDVDSTGIEVNIQFKGETSGKTQKYTFR